MKLVRSIGFWFSRKQSSRRPAATGCRFRPRLEGLEDRAVPSVSSLAAPHLGPALAAPITAAAQQNSLLNITGLNVTNVAVTAANQLTATLNATGTILGQPFTLPNIQVPITVTGINTSGATPILHLQLQIPDLNVLGLHVQLDNCNNGPITVDVTAIPSTQPGGGLLGDVLSGLSNVLSSNNLLNLVGTSLTQFTGAIEQTLNGILGQLLTSAGAATGGTTASSGHGHKTADLVNLHLNSITLDVLGLEVQTSAICLDIYAEKGGGLLGNLLYKVDHLLSNPGNPLHAITTRVENILGILNGLTL
jgi:hypothetical protein